MIFFFLFHFDLFFPSSLLIPFVFFTNICFGPMIHSKMGVRHVMLAICPSVILRTSIHNGCFNKGYVIKSSAQTFSISSWLKIHWRVSIRNLMISKKRLHQPIQNTVKGKDEMDGLWTCSLIIHSLNQKNLYYSCYYYCSFEIKMWELLAFKNLV